MFNFVSFVRWSGAFIFSVLAGQAAANVICNPKSVTTNIRSGPSARATEIVGTLKNNTSVTILEKVRNPENTHDWLKINFRNASGEAKTGFVYHELIGPNCAGDTAASASSSAAASVPATANSVSISQDPKGTGNCAGYTIPVSLLFHRYILNRDFTAKDVMGADCEKVQFGGLFDAKRDGRELTIKLRLPQRTIRTNESCYASVRIAGFFSSGSNFVAGEAYVTTTGRLSDRGCDGEIRLVKGETNSNNYAHVVYFDEDKVYLSKSAWQNVQDQKRAAQARQASAVEDAFVGEMRAKDGPQGLYLFAGQLERDNKLDRAGQVYNYIIKEHPKSDWAVKANDRLLAMRENADAAQRASNAQYEADRSRKDRREICQRRRSECFSGCGGLRDFSTRDRCESACPSCL